MSTPLPACQDGDPPPSLPADSHGHARKSSTSTGTFSTTNDAPATQSEEIATHDFLYVPIPVRLRHDPAKPPHFSLFLNAVFGLASTFREYQLRYHRRVVYMTACIPSSSCRESILLSATLKYVKCRLTRRSIA